MAKKTSKKKKLTNDTKGYFAKGGQGGPGRTPLSDEDKALAKLTRTRFRTIVRKYLQMNKAQLQEVAQAEETEALDLMVISVMNKAILKGDEKRINWFLEQLFGKLKETRDISVTGDISTVVPTVVILPSNGREKKVENIQMIE